MVVNFNDSDIRKTLYKLLNLVDSIQPDPENKTTDKEKHLLIEFLLLDQNTYGIYRFSRRAREQVIKQAMEESGWKLTTRNISNKVLSMIHKGLLTREIDNEIYIKKWLLKVALDIQEAHKGNEKYEIKFRFSNGA
jgi:hypothetical protein